MVKIDDKTRNLIRNESLLILNKMNHNNSPTEKEIELKNLVEETNNFIPQNPDILITRADKSNIIVILNLDDYNNNMKIII